MKIVDVEVIEFKHDWYKPPVPHKWGYGNPDNNNKGEVIESIIKSAQMHVALLKQPALAARGQMSRVLHSQDKC